MRICGIGLLLGLILSVVPQGLVGDSRVVGIQRIDLTGLPEIRLYFTVTDENGDSVLGLTEDDLEITADGVPLSNLNLVSALEEGEFLAVALLFDRSGSMKAALDQIRDVALDFVGRMSEEDQAAVISFDDTVKVELDFTQDRTLIEDAVGRIKLGRNTILYEAVDTAVDLFENIKTPRRAIIILSDGIDTRSKNTRDTVVSKARNSGIPIFSIGFGKTIAKTVLSEMSDKTGGSFFEAASPENLLVLYRKIAERLQNQYRVTIVPDFEWAERWYSLVVTVKEPGGDSGVAEREFIASPGPGVGPDVLRSFRTQMAGRQLLAQGAGGAVFGLLFGLLLALMLKLLRPEVPLLSPLMIGAVILMSALGSVVGVVLVLIR